MAAVVLLVVELLALVALAVAVMVQRQVLAAMELLTQAAVVGVAITTHQTAAQAAQA